MHIAAVEPLGKDVSRKAWSMSSTIFLAAASLGGTPIVWRVSWRRFAHHSEHSAPPCPSRMPKYPVVPDKCTTSASTAIRGRPSAMVKCPRGLVIGTYAHLPLQYANRSSRPRPLGNTLNRGAPSSWHRLAWEAGRPCAPVKMRPTRLPLSLSCPPPAIISLLQATGTSTVPGRGTSGFRAFSYSLSFSLDCH